MKICFLMDPMGTVKVEKDTSWILMVAAAHLGCEIHHLLQGDLFLEDGQVKGKTRVVTIQSSDSYATGDEGVRNLSEMKAVVIRKDPPFDRRYFYSTLLLDFLPSTTKVVNRPQALRDWNEKLSALKYPKFCPPTLISGCEPEILQYVKLHKDVILKPLDGHGGRDITRWNIKQISELKMAIAELTHQGSRKIVVNPYLQEAVAGDKRILLVNGAPIGGILRKAKNPGELNNLDQGGSAEPCKLSDRDMEVCSALESDFVSNGLFFVGIDMLGPWLTEINVTSPTGLQELIRFSGVDHHVQIMKQLIDIQ